MRFEQIGYNDQTRPDEHKTRVVLDIMPDGKIRAIIRTGYGVLVDSATFTCDELVTWIKVKS